ncbi:MAG: hypothetical protein R2827_00910 [Bdellovibrionales bacterium]
MWIKKSGIILLLAVSFTLGCESIKTRSQIKDGQQPPVVQIKELEPGVDLSDETAVEVKTKEVPKIGLIFGPGSVRALAHSGVVDAFQQEKVPVQSIIGLGWGALVGGYYASEGNVTEVQWQLSKLKKEDLVDRSLLSNKIERKNVKEFVRNILPEPVRAKNISQFTIPFACPSVSYMVGQSVFKDSGSFESVLDRCLPTPPVFSPDGVWMADINAIEESIQYMKNKGVNLIVYVNVLGRGDLFEKSEIKDEPETALYWQQVQRTHSRLSDLRNKYPELRELSINVDRQRLLDVGNLRLLPLAGRRAGVRLIEDLKEEFGF